MSEFPVEDEFPVESVSFDLRVTCSVADFPFAVEYIQDFCDGEGFGLDFPPGDGLPYEHTLIDVSDYIGD